MTDDVMRTADGTPLKIKLRQAERREVMRAFMLIAPLFLFIVISFLIPILVMLKNAFYDPDIVNNLPQTTELLRQWDGKALPSEDVFAAFAADLKTASKARTVALVGKRLNYEIPTLKSKVTVTARKLDKIETGPWTEAVIAADPVWKDVFTWAVVKRAGSAFTPYYLLSALDLRQGVDGGIERTPVETGGFTCRCWAAPSASALLVTLCTLILGYPVAFMLATLPQRTASILMIFVLLPFWTSLLVRTTAWTILLQDGGVVAQFLHITRHNLDCQCAWAHVRRAATVQDALCHRAGHDPHPAAIHAAAHLQRDENHIAHLHARGEITGRHAIPRLPHGLCAADHAGRGGGLPAHLHSVPRLFHHAGAGRRRFRQHDCGLH